MESITYRSLTMTVLQSLMWEREQIFDDSHTTYLYTRWRGSVIVSYNPGATSFQAGTPPAPIAGKMPAETDAAIRNYLAQPRGLLTVLSAGKTVLQVPATINGVQAPCDARNGPIVRVQSIQHIPGERLWKIHLEFEAYTNEEPPFWIVSNRWNVSVDVNWQNLTTRTYQGTCTVRGDLLRTDSTIGPAPAQIDSLRSSFAAFSVPTGFQRTNVKVNVYPDGNSADYTVTDTEQLWNKYGSCPAVRVEVQDSAWFFKGSFAHGLTSLNPGSKLPKYYTRCHARVWGNQQRSRLDLLTLGMQIVLGRLGVFNVAEVATAELLIAQDTNNYVDVSYTRAWDYSALGTTGTLIVAGYNFFVSGAPPDAGGAAFVNFLQRSPDTLTNNGVRIQQRPDANQNNPAFPGDKGTRGTYLGTLLTQVLEGFNTAPKDPP